MFGFLRKRTARARMDELEHFLEFWYGPRQPDYGEPEERLARLPLPYPLRRFYAFAGRWPPLHPSYEGDRFYTGHGGPLALRAFAYAAEGNVGYILGGYAGKAGEPDSGKFTLTLRKGGDGRWLIVSDMDSSNRRPR